MKLLSMTDFVLRETNSPTTLAESFQRCVTYANFLKQPLKLEMFVSVDEVGNLLEEPLQEHYTDCTEEQNAKDWFYNLEKYKKAKEKVLFLRFDGSEFDSSLAKVYLENYFNIEQLSNEVKDQILTKNAIKQLGL